MKLTGKAEEAFLLYIANNRQDVLDQYQLIQFENKLSFVSWWSKLPDSFKYGVYVDFFKNIKAVDHSQRKRKIKETEQTRNNYVDRENERFNNK